MSLITFDSFANLEAGTFSNYTGPQLGPGPNYSVGGLASSDMSISPVPIPATAWLFSAALVGLIGFVKKRERAN